MSVFKNSKLKKSIACLSSAMLAAPHVLGGFKNVKVFADGNSDSTDDLSFMAKVIDRIQDIYSNSSEKLKVAMDFLYRFLGYKLETVEIEGKARDLAVEREANRNGNNVNGIGMDPLENAEAEENLTDEERGNIEENVRKIIEEEKQKEEEERKKKEEEERKQREKEKELEEKMKKEVEERKRKEKEEEEKRKKEVEERKKKEKEEEERKQREKEKEEEEKRKKEEMRKRRRENWKKIDGLEGCTFDADVEELRAVAYDDKRWSDALKGHEEEFGGIRIDRLSERRDYFLFYLMGKDGHLLSEERFSSKYANSDDELWVKFLDSFNESRVHKDEATLDGVLCFSEEKVKNYSKLEPWEKVKYLEGFNFDLSAEELILICTDRIFHSDSYTLRNDLKKYAEKFKGIRIMRVDAWGYFSFCLVDENGHRLSENTFSSKYAASDDESLEKLVDYLSKRRIAYWEGMTFGEVFRFASISPEDYSEMKNWDIFVKKIEGRTFDLSAKETRLIYNDLYGRLENDLQEHKEKLKGIRIVEIDKNTKGCFAFYLVDENGQQLGKNKFWSRYAPTDDTMLGELINRLVNNSSNWDKMALGNVFRFHQSRVEDYSKLKYWENVEALKEGVFNISLNELRSVCSNDNLNYLESKLKGNEEKFKGIRINIVSESGCFQFSLVDESGRLLSDCVFWSKYAASDDESLKTLVDSLGNNRFNLEENVAGDDIPAVAQ